MRLQQLRKSGLALAIAGLMSLPTASMADIISTGDPTDNFSWAYDTGSSLLTGFGSMTISGFNTSLLTVAVSLSNTSSIGGIGGERLTAFGFGIDPNATGVAFGDVGDGGIINAKLNQNFPGYATVEVCSYGGSTCAGGGNGGIFAGTSDSFTLLLAGTWGSSVTIDPLALKYQTGYGSFEFSPSPPPSGQVPEPATASLMGLALAMFGAGFVRRRKKNA
jgi:hypothetical protein